MMEVAAVIVTAWLLDAHMFGSFHRNCGVLAVWLHVETLFLANVRNSTN